MTFTDHELAYFRGTSFDLARAQINSEFQDCGIAALPTETRERYIRERADRIFAEYVTPPPRRCPHCGK